MASSNNQPEPSVLTAPDPRVRIRPELLAPAGDRECMRAAVENGADAVYFGLNHGFNARARATNIAGGELAETMQFLHRRGVKGYVTLNTLVFPSELREAEDTIRLVAESDVDAVLVQDLGVAQLVHEVCPELAIHASTQMTLTSAESMEVAAQLGAERVVVARELSVDEIRAIHEQSRVPLEVFVHGALCVAYSGQCLTSESLGGRSANRGQCAQACRLPYQLICDGQDVDLQDVQYLLSPQDLAAYELVAELIDAGAVSFKIEGRLKTPEYVANITRHYRQAIDAALAGRPVPFTPRDIEEMELSFSRGFSPGWLRGCDHKMLVPGLSSAKRGVRLGEVTQVRDRRVQLRLRCSLKPGDGIVFEGDRARNEEQGGRVFAVYRGNQRLEDPVSSGLVEIALGRDALDLSRLWVGQQVWKTDDPELVKRWRKTFAGDDPQRRIPLRCVVRAAVGERLVVDAHAAHGIACQVVSEDPLEAARTRPADRELLQTQLGRLGGTAYELTELEAEIVGGPMIPLSVLGKLRHALVAQLDERAMQPRARTCHTGALDRLRQKWSQRWTEPEEPASAASAAAPRLRLLCRTLAQLDAVLALGLRQIYVDFQDIREYREAVTRARRARAEIYLATPRIQKPSELGIFRALAKHEPDGMLVRNLGGLAFYQAASIPTVADFSLNAANDLTVCLLRDRGARRVTSSYDLNREQLLDLVSSSTPQWLEVVVHQHMPMFHMEHCVFCAVLSPGTNKTNCGRPCDVHEVKLRDRIGMEHPLQADVGCRNTLYNAIPQSAAEVVPALLAKGVRDFRLELLTERPHEIEDVVALYQQLLAGRVAGKEVWRRLNASNRVGVTRGTLEERRNPLAIL